MKCEFACAGTIIFTSFKVLVHREAWAFLYCRFEAEKKSAMQ